MKTGSEKISQLLMNNGYEPRNKSLDTPAVQSFIKQIDELEIEVEFLTDNKSRIQADVIVIKDAGVNAQALSYIEMSLQEATPLKLPSGAVIMVVKPEAWLFHKGLTFLKRTAKVKKYKDLKTWIESATPQDWDLLEKQDVGGNLTKAGFIDAIDKCS